MSNISIFLSLLLFSSTLFSAGKAQNCQIVQDDGYMSTTYPTRILDEEHHTFNSEGGPNVQDPNRERKTMETPFQNNQETLNSQGQIYIYNLDDAIPPTIPIWRGLASNVQFATVSSPYIKVIVKEDNRVELYVTPSFADYLDIVRAQYLYSDIKLRCRDGTTSTMNLYVTYITDSNTRAPVFSSEALNLIVSQQWPLNVPINANHPFFLRDEDLTLQNARVTLDTCSDDFTVRLTPLFLENQDYYWQYSIPFDYRVEIFMRPNMGAGTYNIILHASDGIHDSYASISLTVTQMYCYAPTPTSFTSTTSRIFKINGNSK